MKGTASRIETGQFGGFAGAVVSQLWSVVKDKSPEELQKYIGNTKDLKDVLIKAFGRNGRQLPFNISGTYPVSVDYDRSIKEAVELGRYDWVDKIINDSNFKTERKGKVSLKIEIIHFNRSISNEEAFEEMDKNDYTTELELHGLLALGEKYPDLQRKFPIVALTSVYEMNGNHHVPSLGRDGSKRILFLPRFEGNWDDHWRFAAIRK